MVPLSWKKWPSLRDEIDTGQMGVVRGSRCRLEGLALRDLFPCDLTRAQFPSILDRRDRPFLPGL